MDIERSRWLLHGANEIKGGNVGLEGDMGETESQGRA